MRTKVDWRSSSRENYDDFCKVHPSIRLSFDEWKKIIYDFNESFKEYLLETGDKAKFPFGFGEFAINKKKRKKIVVYEGKEYINLPIDWKKTREKGKRIYNFNFHTEGFFFGWVWFKKTSRLKNTDLWYFKPTRATSRMLAHYIKVNDSYKDLYKEWKT